eukprot:CAMPEP_0177633140 /NCGR_PEP_ID=MMETSP0447-20121125/2674_1 /TAXON_ID=0 /ORGANISM="Stygamoeba regulata, Strain BSH-02190019" /LENGTH=61 /DNA_ID=CAMNT_0019134771 /DNA_START=1841 /DNA_END=2026 /DNA_ORIENTATION=+
MAFAGRCFSRVLSFQRSPLARVSAMNTRKKEEEEEEEEEEEKKVNTRLANLCPVRSLSCDS